MNKIILVGGIVILVLAGLAAAWFWNQSTKAMYMPGMVRSGENPGTPLEPPAQTAGSDEWEVEPGITLRHFSRGVGRVVLVVHGGPGYPFLEPLSGLERMAGDFEFHYFDQRGCGSSSRPFDRFDSSNTFANMQTLERTLGVGAQIADIERIRRILGEEQLILVGHSWGGFLTALYAAEFPEHVEALVLVSPADVLVMPSPDGGLFEAVKSRLPAEKIADYETFMDDYLDFRGLFNHSEAELAAMTRQFAVYYMEAGGDQVDAGEASLPAQGDPGGWMVFAQYLSLGKRHDYREALAAVEAPVLVVHGERDLQPESASRGYATAFPNARFETLAGAGHFPFEQQPEAFAMLIEDFLGPYK